jgi:hypothetical protein
MVKKNTRWSGGDEKIFRVIDTLEIDGKKWVYYRLENSDIDPKEFSCYEESFIHRFRQILD